MKLKLEDLKQALDDKYAWPGGYPLYLVCHDGEALCVDCGRKEWKRIQTSMTDHTKDGWYIEAVEVNWEDAHLYCANCSTRIESAYAEPEEEIS